MQARLKEHLGHFRTFNPGLTIVLSVLSLTLLGLVVLCSAGQSFNSDPYFIFKRQLMWLAIALGAGVVGATVDLEKLRKWSPAIALVTLFLLLLVLIPGIGVTVNGARRWLDFGPMRLQPSEFAKLALVILLSHYLALNQRYLKDAVRGFVIPCAMIGLFCGLIIKEPDFGTTALTGAVGMTLLFLAGARLVFLLPILGVAVFGFAVLVIFDPVRIKRVTSFLDVEAHKADSGYQLWQGMLAFAAGGTRGVGLGKGRQQLSFLPEAHTDFVFPIIGEELGLLFTVTVVILFSIIFISGIYAVRRAPNLFQFSLFSGCLLLIVMQAMINMGVVTGMLPTKGMSLPFISYGGSNLVLMFLMVGLMLNCLRHWEGPARFRPRDL